MKRATQIAVLAATLPMQPLFAQGTAFTYQGALFAAGALANGNYDFQLIAYDSSVAGNPQGTAYDTNTAVSNGLFVLTPDFGTVFTNANRWLDISVRAHGSTGAYTELSPRQQILPTPTAVYSATAGTATSATTAASATTANNFSAPLLGDVTGSQSATVVSKVGGQTAADVVRGVIAANGATNSNSPGALVARDASGNFTAGTVTANFAGNGSGIAGLVATAINSGTLADARLSTNVPLLNASQMFTGADTFDNISAASVTASNLSGYGGGLRAVNADTLGSNQLSAVNGQSGLGLGTNIYLNNYPVYLGSNQNHGLAYNGNGITNFPSSAVQPDGPVLWGFTGGALGVLNGGPQAALSWNNSGVNVSSNFSANNTPGVNFSQGYLSSGSPQVPIPNNGTIGIQLDACPNSQPAVGFFVIMANAWVSDNGNNIGLQLADITSGTPVLLAQTEQYANDFTMSSVNDLNVSLTFVFPIAAPSTPETFATIVTADGPGSYVLGHNLTVMYFPRQN